MEYMKDLCDFENVRVILGTIDAHPYFPKQKGIFDK